VVTSPDSGAIKNVKAASVTFADGKLAVVAVRQLSGGSPARCATARSRASGRRKGRSCR